MSHASRSKHTRYTLAAVSACLATLGGATAAVADAIPGAEVGLVVRVAHQPRYQLATGGDDDGSTIPGVAMRAEEDFVIPLLLHLVGLKVKGLRVAEWFGLDLGTDIGFGVLGRFVLGGQVSYEINADVGVGVRVFSLTIFGGDDHENFLVGEVSGRYQRIIGRVRYSVAQAGNDEATDAGLSVRLPVGWKILGYEGWNFGIDYDHLALGPATVHLATAMVVLGF